MSTPIETTTEKPPVHRAEVLPFDEFTAKKNAASSKRKAAAAKTAAVSHDETLAESASPEPATVKACAKTKVAKKPAKAGPRLRSKKAGAKPEAKPKRTGKAAVAPAAKGKTARKVSHGETVSATQPQSGSNSGIGKLTAEVKKLVAKDKVAASASLDLARQIGDKIILVCEEIEPRKFSAWCREVGSPRSHLYKQKRIALNWLSLEAAIKEATIECKEVHLTIDGACKLLSAYEKKQQVKRHADGGAEGNEAADEPPATKARPAGKKQRQREALVALKCRAELLEGLLRDNDLAVPEPSAKEQDAIGMAGEAQREFEAADATDAPAD